MNIYLLAGVCTGIFKPREIKHALSELNQAKKEATVVGEFSAKYDKAKEFVVAE